MKVGNLAKKKIIFLKLSIYPPFQNYQSENSRITATKKSSTSSMRAAAVASSEEHYASSRKSHYPNFALSEFVLSKFALAEYLGIFSKPRNSRISH